ncbi:fluoride efflux transporter CrcB [Marinobacter sp.]|uniref:fluoride efflux transporter CrcB n=1 Tax=Marinobacter sp. TaxID=50741 RepID=UPI00384DBF80
MWLSFVAVSAGAVIGANLRWALSLWLNSGYQTIPLGTLAANLVGGGLAGLLLGYFVHGTSLSPEWRLFAITGICGALTTFSTFSLEIVAALQSGRWAMAFAGVMLHVLGSLLMTGVGLAGYTLLRG